MPIKLHLNQRRENSNPKVQKPWKEQVQKQLQKERDADQWLNTIMQQEITNKNVQMDDETNIQS